MVRPLLPFEAQAGAKDVLSLTAPNKITLPQRGPGGGAPGESYAFSFDRVYRADGRAAGAALDEEMIRNVLERFCQGFNGTILAYGQTGSGKTYTMGTAAAAKDSSPLSAGAGARGAAAGGASGRGGGGGGGVVPRAVARLFEYLDHAAALYDTSLRATYVEIYNEAVQDLLAPAGPPAAASYSSSSGGGSGGGGGSSSGGGGGVAIREGPGGEILLDGACEAAVATRSDVAALLARGAERRATGAHRLNDASSRSHAVLTLTLEQRARPGGAGAGVPRALRFLRSKLSLVDLAGSERAKQTGTTGARFQEGVSINSGLLALGNVITALSEAQRGGGGRGGGGAAARRHVPYRDSKLTRLLQDGLGGNSETLFIACVSPADASHEHTVGTLRYASRAMLISNSLQLNNAQTPEQEAAFLRSALEASQAEAAALRAEVAALQAENAALRARGGGSGGGG
ncbi:MAG: kinesin-domain-containing protein [Monoraphidium minutum]|nr:MAG: kinesin-domain-containing protein [Monoraphidium minutum]